MSDVNDRGSIKWTSLMIPEHEEMLRKWWASQEYKEKPILDEQQKEDINARLQAAFHHSLPIEVTYHHRGEFFTAKGKLVTINAGKLILEDEGSIALEKVVDVVVEE
ncbi:YolD-like protein [Lentibacillus persicus]|uniref:YolD-like protein n=1 Tax=Lentibacillus persicus TaxID=640948 RepID=A0A1I1S7Z8_9BACI|nr:YolD-like family protein [Lentibacillus persicus]SFD42619.1 YolD-like protein [Lentibacillus persicus]